MSSPAHNATSNPQGDDVLHLDPDLEVSRVEDLGVEWADKDAAASMLEETKKTLLAQLVQNEQLGAKATGGKVLSMSQAENNAMANPQFEAHLRQMVEARKEANRAKVRYDTGRVKIELMRSLVAARREEMRMGGFRT
jgi:hypothetical protein